ncbi:MAG: Diguanylate cyclase with sensor, partial [Proteobacteria bacterium]|nr:Diguanylate cyclase with sensor [Pseudomonadota bacterium]
KAMFLNEGIPLEKLQFVADQHHLSDFIGGQVTGLYAYLSNEPFALQQQGIAYSLLKPQTYGMDFYGDALFTRQALAQERPEVVAAFRAASIRGWEYALEHPDEIIDLILAHYNTQGKDKAHLQFEARSLDSLIRPKLIQIGHSNTGRWSHIVQTYARFGVVKAEKSLDDFFYEPNRKVDLTRLYFYLAVALTVLLGVGGVAFYIHRINRRLQLAVNQQVAVEVQLRDSESRYRVFFETSPSAGIVWREGFIITDWNSQAAAMFGWSRQEVLGRDFSLFLLPAAEREQLLPELGQLLQHNVRPHGVNDNLTRDGRVITCEWFNAWLPEMPGQPREIISLAIDISDRKAAEQVREEAFEFLRKVSANAPGVVYQYRLRPDGSSHFPYVSSRIELFGLSPESLAEDASPIFAAAHPDDVGPIQESIRQSALNLTPWRGQFRIRQADGSYRWYEGQSTPEREADGGIVWYGYYADIQAQKETEAQITAMALHDALTGLPNRALFTDRMENALAAARRDQTRLAQLFIDLDKFKPINDRFGHALGDELLKEVAARMRASIRESDTAARIGGDEFVVLLRNIQQQEDALAVAEKIRQAISQPFIIAGHRLSISASIGLSHFPEHGSDLLELSKNADQAMYRAKQQGRDGVVIYLPDLDSVC